MMSACVSLKLKKQACKDPMALLSMFYMIHESPAVPSVHAQQRNLRAMT